LTTAVSNNSPSICDPSITSCAEPPAATGTASPPVVDIPPVYIEGDAGTRELVKRADAARAAPACTAEARSAGLAGAKLAKEVIVAATAGATLGPLGAAVGVGCVFIESIEAGKSLRALYDCKNQ
jgi:hypothetical protein